MIWVVIFRAFFYNKKGAQTASARNAPENRRYAGEAKEYSMNISPIAPFIKWAGGKRQLLPQISARLPENYHTYYEPFVGGGAVLFALCPERAVINDINGSLVNLYRQIKLSPEAIIDAVEQLDGEAETDRKVFYYAKRAAYNEKMMKGEYDVELAALFLYINKHCFNGLYRVNEKDCSTSPSITARQNPAARKIYGRFRNTCRMSRFYREILRSPAGMQSRGILCSLTVPMRR